MKLQNLKNPSIVLEELVNYFKQYNWSTDGTFFVALFLLLLLYLSPFVSTLALYQFMVGEPVLLAFLIPSYLLTMTIGIVIIEILSKKK